MDDAFQTVLAEYNARIEREERGYNDTIIGRGSGPSRDELLLSVGEDVARFLHLLITGCGARSVLEVGTSYGYSTLWLADAVRETGGRLTTLESAPYKADHAREALGRAGLAAQVDFRVGDALEIIPGLEGPFDFVLLDLWKNLYIPCLDLCLPKLAPGAIVVADNMLHPPMNRPEALKYRAAVRRKKELTTVLIPIGQGVELSRLVGPDDAAL